MVNARIIRMKGAYKLSYVGTVKESREITGLSQQKK